MPRAAASRGLCRPCGRVRLYPRVDPGPIGPRIWFWVFLFPDLLLPTPMLVSLSLVVVPPGTRLVPIPTPVVPVPVGRGYETRADLPAQSWANPEVKTGSVGSACGPGLSAQVPKVRPLGGSARTKLQSLVLLSPGFWSPVTVACTCRAVLPADSKGRSSRPAGLPARRCWPWAQQSSATMRKLRGCFGGPTGLRVGHTFFSSLEASKGLRLRSGFYTA